MAKIYKLTKGGQTIFPATTTDAVVNPNSRKSLTEELSELEKNTTAIKGVIDIGSGLNVLDTLNTDDNVGLYYTKSSGRNGLLIVTKSRNNNYGQCLIGGYNANSSGGLEQYSNTVNILRRSYISSESKWGGWEPCYDSESSSGWWNADIEAPLPNGEFHTYSTAKDSIPTKLRVKGMIVTFTNISGEIEVYQMTSVENWGLYRNRLYLTNTVAYLEWTTDRYNTRLSYKGPWFNGMIMVYNDPERGFVVEQKISGDYTDTDKKSDSNYRVLLSSSDIENLTTYRLRGTLIPYCRYLYKDNNGISKINGICTMFLHIEHVKEINIPFLLKTNSNFVITFYDTQMEFIKSQSSSSSIQIPDNAAYMSFTADAASLDKEITMKMDVADSYNDESFIEIPGLYENGEYNISFFGIDIANNHYAVNYLTVPTSGDIISNPVKRIKYIHPYDGEYQHLSLVDDSNQSDVRAWVQDSTDTQRQIYLDKDVKDNGDIEYILAREVYDENLDIYFSPAQTGWNNGVEVFDISGNKLPWSVGRQNNMSEKTTIKTYSYKLVQPSGMVKLRGENEIYLMDSPCELEFSPKTSNLVADRMIFDAVFTVEDTHLSISNSGPRGTAWSALYIPVEEGKNYYVMQKDSGGTLSSGTSGVLVVLLDKNKQLKRALKASDLTWLNGSATFGLKGLYEFKVQEDEVYAMAMVGKYTSAVDRSYIIPVICEKNQVMEAVRGEGFSGVNKGELTGADINNMQKNTTGLKIWILGDSTSSTGFGGSLNTFKHQGGSNQSGAWVKYFVNEIKPEYIANYAAGGYTLTDASSVITEGVVQEPMQSYIARLEQMITAHGTGDLQEPDYLLIVGCTNDFKKSRSNPNGWSNRSFVTDADISSPDLNPSHLDYDDFMEEKFISVDNIMVPIEQVPVFKIAGAIRYIIQRTGTLFPNCKFMICTSLQSPINWKDQEKCHNEMKWMANRLSIPLIDVSHCANTPMLWDMAVSSGEHPRRYINDDYHPYGSQDSAGKSFITAGAMYHGKFIAEMFKLYSYPSTAFDKMVVDYTDSTKYPSEYN